MKHFVPGIAACVLWGMVLSATSYGANDLNGDGRIDIVVPSHADYQNNYIYWGGETAPYYTNANTQLINTNTRPVGTVVSDLTGDGVYDIVFANYDSAGVYILPGPDYDIADKITLPVNNSYSISIGRLNDDQYVDMLVSSYTGGGSSKIFWGDSSYTYGSSFTIDSSGAAGTTIADLNGDGDLDLLLSSYSTNAVKIYYNAGGGTPFPATPSLSLSALGPHGVSVGHIDGDAVLDIVVSSSGSGGNSFVYWGDSGWTRQTELYTGGAAYDCSVSDLDDDGFDDIVFTGASRYFLSNGDESFDAEALLGFDAYGAATADLNSDGLYEILLGGPSAMRIYWSDTGWTAYTQVDANVAYGLSIVGANGGDITALGTTVHMSGHSFNGEGEVPEPSTLLLLLPLLIFGLRKMRRK
ncbi:MAG TPA: VCBS repeat-containing protein [bacterium]|nr:VCBS repeat-containing protein [bacterium]